MTLNLVLRPKLSLQCMTTLLVLLVSQVSQAQNDLSLLSLEELLNVEVTSASKKSQQASDVAAAIYVITAEDLRRSGVSSIPEALRMVPGLHVGRIDDNKWAVSSRGFNDLWGNKLLVLKDGRQLYTPYYGGVLWDTHMISVDNVERIEVIRGPGATLWGSNAVNGIINVISRKPRDSQGLLVDGFTDNDDSHRLGVRYGRATENNWYYRATLDSVKEDVTTTPLSENDFNTWEQTLASFRLDGSPLSGHNLRLEGAYYQGRSKETIKPLFHSHHQGILDLRLTQDVVDTEGGWLMADWEHRQENGAGWSVKAYFDAALRESVIYELDQKTVSLEFEQRLLPWSGHDVVWGTGLRKSSLPLSLNSDNFDLINPDDDFQVVEAFIQDEISLSENLKLTIGSKFEHSQYVDLEIQPNIRLIWSAQEGLALWGSISQAMRTPSRREATMRIFPSEIIPPFADANPLPLRSHLAISGNDRLESESLTAYELGIRARLSRNLDMDLALFQNHYKDLIEAVDVNRTCAPRGENFALEPDCRLDSDHIVRQMKMVNGPSATSRGIEMALNYSISDNWRLRSALSSIGTRSSELEEEILLNTDGPDWIAYLRSEWNIARNLELDVTLRASDEIDRFGVGSYTTADIRFGWRVRPEFVIELIGQNLGDQGHREFGSTLQETSPARVGRSVRLRATWAP